METIKKFYAKADNTPYNHLTSGKEYEIIKIEWSSLNKHNSLFTIINDDGEESACLQFGCAHLKGGNWEIIQK